MPLKSWMTLDFALMRYVDIGVLDKQVVHNNVTCNIHNNNQQHVDHQIID